MLISKDTLVSKPPEQMSRIPHLTSIDMHPQDEEKVKYCNMKTQRKWNQTNHHHHQDHFQPLRRKSYCIVSVTIAFIIGFGIGAMVMGSNVRLFLENNNVKLNISHTSRTLNSINEVSHNNLLREKEEDFTKVSFTETPKREVHDRDIYPKGMTEDMKDILKDNKDNRKHEIKIAFDNKTVLPTDRTILYDNIFWGPQVENAIPEGYGRDSAENWEEYIRHAEVVKMEPGCGRMQNRLVTFRDGLQACVRYRQNTDQIQGEIFSFYVSRLLNLTNLAPSVVSLVDLKDKLWQNVATDITNVQWNTNRAVVLTQYIPGLESAPIPQAFKPSERHLNKLDVLKMALKDNDANVKTLLIDKLKKYHVVKENNTQNEFDHIDMKVGDKTLRSFVELAQWSDLIVFDYLTANLDRVVNNLFNFQWNVNIMDGPAHNLARKVDSGLLMFLDNESGLLHGYRLLKKYNVYHSLMLDNLCVYRKATVDYLKTLYDNKSVGIKISQMFKKKNNAVIRDILPPLPEKNVKILLDRIGKVLYQVHKCEESYSKR